MLIPAAAFALLTFCSPGGDRQNPETGMGGATAGGISSNDTMPTAGGDTASPAGEANPTPAAMLSQLNVGNTMEIQLGTLALKQAASPQVKQIARKLVADHTKNRAQLQALAQKLNLDLTPSQGGDLSAADSTALPASLQGVSGAAFDKAFISQQIEDHQSNIEKIRSQMIPVAQDQQLKSFLQKTVKDMEGHLAALQRVQQQVGA
jgi:putative membrane protein